MFVFVKRETRAMTRRGRTCVVPECDQRAVIGSVVCNEHKGSALGEQTDREILKMTQRLSEMAKLEESGERREAAQEFRRQVARGDYATLFSTKMVESLKDEGRGYGLRQEIGMMRVAMMRLLLEEESPSKMAHALAKLSSALGKSMQIQEGWDEAEANRMKRARYLADQRSRVSQEENAFWNRVEGMGEVDAVMRERPERASGRSPELDPDGFEPLMWSPDEVREPD
jgi:hypothetical protein